MEAACARAGSSACRLVRPCRAGGAAAGALHARVAGRWRARAAAVLHQACGLRCRHGRRLGLRAGAALPRRARRAGLAAASGNAVAAPAAAGSRAEPAAFVGAAARGRASPGVARAPAPVAAAAGGSAADPRHQAPRPERAAPRGTARACCAAGRRPTALLIQSWNSSTIC